MPVVPGEQPGGYAVAFGRPASLRACKIKVPLIRNRLSPCASTDRRKAHGRERLAIPLVISDLTTGHPRPGSCASGLAFHRSCPVLGRDQWTAVTNRSRPEKIQWPRRMNDDRSSDGGAGHSLRYSARPRMSSIEIPRDRQPGQRLPGVQRDRPRRIAQKPLPHESKAPAQSPWPLSEPERARLAKRVEPIEDDALRASLERLGATVSVRESDDLSSSRIAMSWFGDWIGRRAAFNSRRQLAFT